MENTVGRNNYKFRENYIYLSRMQFEGWNVGTRPSILRNEILSVTENAKRFTCKNVILAQFDNYIKTETIEKTVVKKLGYKKVIGLQIIDQINERFDPKKVGTIHKLSGSKYTEKPIVTLTKWIFE